MAPSDFPLEKTSRTRPELGNGSQQSPALYGYVESSRALVDAAPGYDSFLDYWRILMRHQRTLLRFALAGLAAAMLISLVQTPLYRAKTSLEIRDFNENFLDLRSADPSSSAGSRTIPESYFETQIKILQSESLLERVIDKLKLNQARPASGWRAFTSRARQMLDLSGSSRPPEKEGKEELIHQAGRNLTVRAAPNTRLLEVLYESEDPKLSAGFANTLVSEFIEQSQEMRWKSARRTGEWLTNHLGELKAKLEQSEAQLQEYARTSGLTFTSEKVNLEEVRLREMQDDLSRAHADRVAKEAKSEEAKSKQIEALPEMLDDPTLRDHLLKLTDLQRQFVELGATLTPEHYRVQRVQAQIAELQSAVRKQRRLILSRISNEYTTARRREKFLADAYTKQEKVVADQSSKAIHYDTLKREVDSTRQLYEAMLQRVKQAEFASAMRASNVLVVDVAKPPILPYRPALPMNSALGLFGGMFLGFGFVLFRERFDRRIQAPGEMRAYLNLPELGVIPPAEIPSAPQIRNLLSMRGRLIASWLAEIPGNGRANRPMRALPAGPHSGSQFNDCPELATWNRKPSLLAESFRATLTSILLHGQNGDRPRVVVVTSPIPGDGKTTVASNLGIAMAETGRKVLLIDGDLRCPRVHTVFGVSNSRGMSDVLSANTPLDEGVPIRHLVCETKVSGLCLLPGGHGTITPSSLFYSSRMSRLLERLRREFDMVLVDAPPMIHLADARVLGRLADGVILVIRAGQTPMQSAVLASQRFAEDGTRVLGTVLNNWDPGKGPSYQYAYRYLGKY